MRDTTTRRKAPLFFIALLTLLALVLAACGGSSGGSKSSDTSSGSTPSGDEGKPQTGGTITYGLEGKTTAFCPPRAQWAISGIMVANAVYDTLTRPTDDPNTYAPYLAQSITPSNNNMTWTIKLRPGITFHDGEPLNAAAVVQNIEAWTKGILLGFVFSNIQGVAALSDDTVVVNMKKPWVAFPAFLWSTGRTAIAAPAQLNNEATCDTNMIGTGPFKLAPGGFDPTTGDVKTVKNDDYWRKGFPYLDGINFKPQEESSQRIRGLAGGEFDITHSSGGLDLDEVKSTAPSATVTLEPNGRMELSQMLINDTRAPLDDLTARQAIAYGLDRNRLNDIANKGSSRLADQVFDTDVMGYDSSLKYPKQNISKAKSLVNEYKSSHGGKFAFELQGTFDNTTQALAQEVKRQLGQVGITVNLPSPVDQATIINKAIGGTVDSFLWRNYPGQDPDTLYVWLYGGSVVNFNHLDDATVNQALDDGRSESDPTAREADYKKFSAQLTNKLFNFWSWYTQWFIASQPSVHGIVGPNLPDENGGVGDVKPVPILAGIHQVVGLWVSK